jgi:NDP-sugar pyrophosphorylase family protein
MKTVILLAGHARRMRPLSDYMNKGMVPVAGKPLAEHIVERLVAAGLNDLIFAVHRFPEQLERHFGDGQDFGAAIQYVRRGEALGTAGEVHALCDQLPSDESFLVHYGDILTNIDLRGMVEQHQQTEPTATIGLVTGVKMHAGIADVDADGKVIDFQEKPAIEHPCHAAIDVFSPRIWSYLGPHLDFGYDVFGALLEAGEDVRGYVDRAAWWMDVGRLSDLEDAAELVMKQR